jgi:hypothetical protein
VLVRVLVALTVSVAVAGTPAVAAAPLSGSRPHRTGRTVVVPKVIDLPMSRAECRLAVRGLRWRWAGDDRVHRSPGGRCGRLMTPDPAVTAQRPRPGRRVPVGTVVTLDNVCLEQVRAGGLPCA